MAINSHYAPPPLHSSEQPESLGEVVDANRLVSSVYNIPFRTDLDYEVICTEELTPKQLKKFRNAVAKDYYFQMFYDGLPIWGFVGKVEKEKDSIHAEFEDLHLVESKYNGPRMEHYFLFTHLHFDILYNDDRVIEVSLSTDPTQVVDITEPEADGGLTKAEFSFSVKWRPTKIEFEDRMLKYKRYQFLPQHLEIHWFSIINSLITVLLLVAFLATILLKILRKDFARYNTALQDDEEDYEEDETGWKLVHGDVFRFPRNKALFSAFIGAGTQIYVVVLIIFALAMLDVFYPYNRGAFYTAAIFALCLTSIVGGYVSGSLHRQMEGTRWAGTMVLTMLCIVAPFILVFCFNNTVAWAWGSTAAFPFGTIMIIVAIWVFIAFQLMLLGGIIGKNRESSADFDAPCRTNKYEREVPQLPWYRTTLPQMVIAGFLPFSAIYIELYYVFASVWGHKMYTVFSILFIVFLILTLVTGFITIALTYFQLSVEDHRWWWRSVLCGGSTAAFIYSYCFYYFHARSEMDGLLQTSFFFGYMFCVCWVFFVMLGSVGWRASLWFIRKIYRAIKAE